MAILGFHFSAPYKEPFLNGAKIATIAEGEDSYKIGTRVELYISDMSNLLDGVDEKRFGHGIISESSALRVSALTNEHALNCGHKDLEDLLGALIKWYGVDKTSLVTYTVFNPVLYSWGAEALKSK